MKIWLSKQNHTIKELISFIAMISFVQVLVIAAPNLPWWFVIPAIIVVGLGVNWALNYIPIMNGKVTNWVYYLGTFFVIFGVIFLLNVFVYNPKH